LRLGDKQALQDEAEEHALTVLRAVRAILAVFTDLSRPGSLSMMIEVIAFSSVPHDLILPADGQVMAGGPRLRRSKMDEAVLVWTLRMPHS